MLNSKGDKLILRQIDVEQHNKKKTEKQQKNRKHKTKENHSNKFEKIKKKQNENGYKWKNKPIYEICS